MGHTLVAFHAHPDDEALTTGGTLAKAAAAGHRVVLVTATDGAVGLASSRYAGTLADTRRAELLASAAVLGVARVELLGYADSGLGPVRRPDPPGQVCFSRASVEQAAERLAELLREESANVLLSYDRNGGYGHPDHVQVHRVGALAATLARTPRLLEVAVDRRTARIMAPRGFAVQAVPAPTHVVDVRAWIEVKREAVRAHRSQLTSEGWLPRNNAMLLRLPGAVLRRVMGWERYVDPSRHTGAPVLDDVFADL
ncbi:MAG: PIG-L deacetylase family protein [Dermatophilaceae bacterium]